MYWGGLSKQDLPLLCRQMMGFQSLALVWVLCWSMPEPTCPLEVNLQKQGMKKVRLEIPAVRVDLRYSSKENFVGQDVYGCLEEAYLHPLALKKLHKAWKLLQEKKPGYTFKIFDAARPLSVQWKLWKAMPKPENQKRIYLADPRKGSIHNYGFAVDLTLLDASGNELDMGTPFDFFGPKAQPRLEGRLVKTGQLSATQLANRKLLRETMVQAGFSITSSEWWHFNATSLKHARQTYPILP